MNYLFKKLSLYLSHNMKDYCYVKEGHTCTSKYRSINDRTLSVMGQCFRSVGIYNYYFPINHVN